MLIIDGKKVDATGNQIPMSPYERLQLQATYQGGQGLDDNALTSADIYNAQCCESHKMDAVELANLTDIFEADARGEKVNMWRCKSEI